MKIEGQPPPAQPTNHHKIQISDTLPTRSSSFSSVGFRNNDQPLSSTFSPFSSSFNYSPPRNTGHKRRRVFNLGHQAKVGGRCGCTASTSPLPSKTQPENDTELVLPPIIKVFREQELAKFMFLLIVPIIAAVINLYNRLGHPPPPVLPHIILGLVLLGILFIWNGLLLKETYQRISVAAELLGSSFVILSLVLLVACVVPGVTPPWLLAGFFCFGICLVPFFLALRHLKNN